MRRFALLCAALGVGACLLVTMVSCGSQTNTTPTAASGGVFRLEQYCDAEGLVASKRHTYLMLDEHVLSKADNPEDFAALNGHVRDVVMAFADPDGSTLSGAMDYRERLSIFLAPADGSAAKQLFDGCLPALSPEEMRASQRQGSAVGAFFTGGAQQALHNATDLFRSRVVSALVLAARDAKGPAAPESSALPQTKLMDSLRASGHLFDGEQGLPRIILLSNLARIDLGGDATRESVRALGFSQGAQSALDLGRSELHIFLADGPHAALARDYAQAFFLAQHANLISWAGDQPTAMPAAPASVQRFAGEAAYPNGPESIQVRIAADRNGALVDSWIVLRGSPNRSTPLTGQISCASEGSCQLINDDGGFAQAWSVAPGGEPEFDNTAPFGGLRDWRITIDNQRLSGSLFDAAVQQIGPVPGTNSIPLQAQLAESATF